MEARWKESGAMRNRNGWLQVVSLSETVRTKKNRKIYKRMMFFEAKMDIVLKVKSCYTRGSNTFIYLGHVLYW